LVPEQIILDDEIYHTNRILAEGIELNDETLALDVISKVGPKGNFLSQKHTRKNIRNIWIPELTHARPSLNDGNQIDAVQRAKDKFAKILSEHRPEPLEDSKKVEIERILNAALKELGDH
jgi:trimethylamine--corrinoid protein Co-methyltransferase